MVSSGMLPSVLFVLFLQLCLPLKMLNLSDLYIHQPLPGTVIINLPNLKKLQKLFLTRGGEGEHVAFHVAISK
jgi:hypothetical protein